MNDPRTAQSVLYGLRSSDGSIDWTDDDGELYVRGDYIAATSESDLPALREAVKAAGTGQVIVQRDLGPIVETGAPLPTTRGSVVRAVIDGERVIAILADNDELPWKATTVSGYLGDWYSASDLSGVEVLFDAAEVTA